MGWACSSKCCRSALDPSNLCDPVVMICSNCSHQSSTDTDIDTSIELEWLFAQSFYVKLKLK